MEVGDICAESFYDLRTDRNLIGCAFRAWNRGRQLIDPLADACARDAATGSTDDQFDVFHPLRVSRLPVPLEARKTKYQKSAASDHRRQHFGSNICLVCISMGHTGFKESIWLFTALHRRKRAPI